MVKGTRCEPIVVGHVDETYRNCDRCTKFLLHEIGHFGKVHFVDVKKG